VLFVDRYTIRIYGEVIKHGPDRKGHPVISEYESRKKDKKKKKSRWNWNEEFKSTGMRIDEVEKIADSVAASIEKEKPELAKLRRKLSQLRMTQLEACHINIRVNTKESYQVLREARQNVRDIRGKLLPKENILRDLRQESYYWNNILKYGKSSKEKRSNSNESKNIKSGTNITKATWSHHSVEDATETLDITKLINSRGKRKQVVFSGTDYGICKMSQTVPLTFSEIEEHVNRYKVLGKTHIYKS
jgi:ribonuclease BN (tRNA processing enzyme)